MTGKPSKPSKFATLPRHLGVTDTVAIYVGIIVGSGIFVAPSAATAAGSSTLFSVGLWAVAGVIALSGAFVYAECGARLPHPGGFYIFYRETFGPGVAFLGGWAAFLVTYPASIAAISRIFGQYLGDAVPFLAPYTTANAVVALIAAGVLNVVGLRTGPTAQKLLTAIKVLALVLLCVAAALSGGPELRGESLAPAAGGASSLTLLIGALMWLMWTYDGWSNVGLLAGEVKDPNKTLGRAVLIGTVVLILLYATVQASVESLLPRGQLAESKQVVSDAVRAGLGNGAGRWVSVLVVISTFGALAGSLLAGARIGYAMAEDRLLPRWLSYRTQPWDTPGPATMVLTLACVAFAVSGGFDELLALFSFSAWLFYALVTVSLLVLRHRGVGGPDVWRAPGGLLAPVVILLASAAMTVGVFISSPKQSLAGIGLLVAGAPAYWIWRRFRRDSGD